VSSLPRGSNPALAAEAAAALIRASFPALATEGLRHLGSGWEFDAFLTADGWVFRFPRGTDHVDYADVLDTERRLHALLAAVLPPPVAVPHVELVGQPSAEFPFRFAGHRFLPGTPADAAAPALVPTTARTIGAALGALHAVPKAAARAAGVGVMDPHDAGWKYWLEGGVTAAAALRGTDAVVDRALDWLAQQSLPPAAFPGRLCLIHNDLSPEHLLVDPATGVLVGILDWTDAILDDPAREFAPLAASCGWAFAEEVLRSYPAPVDQAFRERVSFMARLLSVIWLATASEHAADAERHMRCVRNAFDASAP
jgi:aminoglycoside phosphotransferase (APT) family kinase protein